MPRKTRLKVCCIKSAAEAQLAAKAGADFIGLVGPMPSGPGTIRYEDARHIAAAVPQSAEPWLLTSETAAKDLADVADFTGVPTLQIVRHVEPSVLENLAKLRPGIKRIQVLHVEDESALELMQAYSPYADGFLLDSGRPTAAVETLGGTGNTHDWSISARLVASTPKPVMLAGGLNAGNILEAVNQVRPFGVDLCSSLRREDALIPELLHAFSDALTHADKDDL